MQSGAHSNLLIPGRLNRGIALFFLVFPFIDLAVVDLAFPQLCSEEVSASALTGSVHPPKKETSAAWCAAASEPQQEEPARPAADDEDCFCCCAHILPSTYFRLPAFQIRSEKVVSITAFLPSAPSFELFRPPRIA